MTITELLPQLKELSLNEKLEIFEFLKKDLEKYNDDLIGCTHFGGAEAALKMMEFLEEHAKAKV